MNKILYILIALLTPDCDSFAQMVDIENLKGKVKEVKQYSIVESSGNLIKDSILLLCKYDDKG